MFSKNFNVKIADIKSEKRDREITMARQVAMYIAREVTNLSYPYPVIGNYFEKNHVSVIQSYKKIKSIIDEDTDLRLSINSITSVLNSKKTTDL